MSETLQHKNGIRAANEEREAAQLTLGGSAPLLLDETNLPQVKRPITKAEKWFDSALYVGFMGVFNAVYSVWLADEVREGRGKAFFERTAKQIAHRMAPPNASAQQFTETVQRIKHTNINMVLTGCGIMLLFPMKWFENRKPQLVRWIHEKYSKSTDPEKAAQDEAALKQLDNTPVLGWGPIVTGRAVGMVGPFMTSWYGTKFVQHTEDAAAKFAEHDLKLRSPSAIRYSRMISLELLYAGICTSGLYIYTHFIKPPKKEGDAAEVLPPTATQPADSTENSIPATKNCAPCAFKRMKNYADHVSSHHAETAMEVAP